MPLCVGKIFPEEQRFALPVRDPAQALAALNPNASKSEPSPRKGEINLILPTSGPATFFTLETSWKDAESGGIFYGLKCYSEVRCYLFFLSGCTVTGREGVWAGNGPVLAITVLGAGLL